ncbi:MAG: hypothetical protein COA96_05580 [SAR86 cluster bacterium]|uniref:Uncharacterized protein n=1 Tax=SAR86 cluster bacterium TaxID=2030880 RepID=A0A2A5B3R4_9GAMM|nr:MAG: hypothetical protein COA96_05580 [SAR86 cluster bacterium]
MTTQEESKLYNSKLQGVASRASERAIKKAHDLGHEVTIVEGNTIIKWFPDGHKETIQTIRGRSVKSNTLAKTL